MKRLRKLRIPWLAALVIPAIAIIAIGRATGKPAHHHPEPRPGITAANVLPGFMRADYPSAERAYNVAARYPRLLDSLYCWCNCGHRSLLTCFESLHGANCDICQQEAMVAAVMQDEGQSLAMIREATNVQFGGGT